MAAVATGLGLLVAGSVWSISADAQQKSGAPTFTIDATWPQEFKDHWIMGSVTGVFVDSKDHECGLDVHGRAAHAKVCSIDVEVDPLPIVETSREELLRGRHNLVKRTRNLLGRNANAKKFFEGLSYSKKNILVRALDVKNPEVRNERIAKTVEQLKEGRA